jgi:hypothetical protein
MTTGRINNARCMCALNVEDKQRYNIKRIQKKWIRKEAEI